MPALIAAKGGVLARVLESRSRKRDNGLTGAASRAFHAARMGTTWGALRQRSYALIEGDRVLASAERYALVGVLDGQAVDICGIGSVCAEPTSRGPQHAGALVEALVDDAARRGAAMALLFPERDVDGVAPDEHDQFRAIVMTDLTLVVAESQRHGAPMTTVRGGEPRDLAAIVAMGRIRAAPVRFHLDRDVDFVQYVVTTRRLLAGLGPVAARQLQFFIAEEGITAAAYVIISVADNVWTLEECGDRDPSGARVGALLQALIAREPGERRPAIRGWLPPRFLPPQVTIASSGPSPAVIGLRLLGARSIAPPLSSDDVLFWRNDLL